MPGVVDVTVTKPAADLAKSIGVARRCNKNATDVAITMTSVT